MARRILLPRSQEWKQELEDLIRGASGGFLFGIPLLYTMETWWIGSYIEPPLMLVTIVVTFLIVFFLNRTDGFRQLKPDRPIQAMMDSVEAVAIGVLCVTFVLVLLREITFSTSLDESLGKIVLESFPFAIGVALARSIMQGEKNNPEDDQAEGSGSRPSNRNSSQNSRYNATLADIGATLVGTVIIAFNIAPTDEVPMLVSAVSPPWLVAIVLASLLISYCIVFVAGFTTQQKRRRTEGMFQHPMTETMFSYLISLIAAATMLWFFHRLDPSVSWTLWLENVIILGLPATIGGAAGRLAV
ncbi:MAG: TIGR02587 family membrane protein [Elainellaceae cyanobacterium]